MVVVVLERQVFMFGVFCLVVVVVKIVQLDKIQQSDFLLMTGKVMDKMMEKCAHFQEGLHSLATWRTGRQNLEGKTNEQVFFHCGNKGK